MTLENLYNKIAGDEDKWNYYNKDIEIPDFADTTSCQTFIERYINLSGKGRTVLTDKINYLIKNDSKRLNHTVSVFFLGISLYYKCGTIKQAIDTKLKKLLTKNEFNVESEFCYLWFMTSLFHDLGYYHEVNKDYNCIIEPLNNLTGVPILYDINRYYIFRKDICNCPDHGIVAGKLLYEDLCRIREYEHHKQEYNLKYCSKLYWGEDLKVLYKYVASCISVHNIFFIRDGEGDPNEGYYNEHMPSLVLKSKNSNNSYDDYPIKLKEYPILFLLCLVDSLEPLKKSIPLSDIEIKITKKQIKIISSNQSYQTCISGLNSWLIPINKDDTNYKIKL